MAFQFMHIESYGRNLTVGNKKAPKTGGHTVRSIVAEAIREPGNTLHIDEPMPPVLLHGHPLEQLEATCDAWASTSIDASGRKLRKDALCLVAGVFSAPDCTPPEAWEKIKGDALEWLQGRYGDRLQTVVEHIDESHPHCHFYIVPRPGERFDTIHDGKKAANELGRQSLKGDRNKAYKAAMRAFQDDYYENVGAPNGMARLGPGRRRLTREGWKLEQIQAETIALKFQQAEAMMKGAGKAVEVSQVTVDALKSSALADIREMQAKAVVAADKAQEAARLKGIEDGRKEAVKEFGKSSLWGKLTKLLSSKDKEIEALKIDNKALKKDLKAARSDTKKSYELLVSVKAAGKSIALKFRGLKRELDRALERAVTAERHRDQLKSQVSVLKERDGAYAGFDKQLSDMAWKRDGQRARADQILRHISKLEASHNAQEVPTAPSARLTHVEPGQTV